MGAKKIYAIIFIFAFILTGIVAEQCKTYEDGNGLCAEECPSGTRFYSADCINPTRSQRTCRHPRHRPMRVLCDYTRCDCIRPNVYDEAAKKCVSFKDCSDQSNVKSDGEM